MGTSLPGVMRGVIFGGASHPWHNLQKNAIKLGSRLSSDMKDKEYEITAYRPQYKTDIMQLLRYMWGGDQKLNLLHFGWKYEQNPFAKGPECYLALDHGQVVGFLGFFVNRWLVGGPRSELAIPVGSDLIVHPEYRDKGLMRALHEAAFKELPERYPVILVFSPNTDSTPRALSLGFTALTEIKRLRKYHFSWLLKRKAQGTSPSPAGNEAPKLGTFGPIEVREKPLPGPMSAFDRGRAGEAHKIALLMDQDFYAWRFESQRRKYLFYYYWENSELKGYLLLRTTGHPPSGVILDFEQTESVVFDKLLRFVMGHVHWSTLTVWDLNLDSEIRRSLRKRKFIPSGWVERVLRRSQADPCVLIRPSKKDFSASDFYVRGLDLRKTENWEFKEICSDIS